MAINLTAKKEEILKSTSNLSKTLLPGSEVCTITKISFKKNDWNNMDGYDIILSLEGKDLTDQGFVGFFIDKEDESLGRVKGAVGNVKMSQYSFATKEYPATNVKAAQVVERDTTILTELGKLAKICGKYDELFEGEVENIEMFIAKAGEVLVGGKVNLTIGGREYLDKNNYIKYELFIVRSEKGAYAMETPGVNPSKLVVFNAAKHIIAKKGGASEIAAVEFEPVSVEFTV